MAKLDAESPAHIAGSRQVGEAARRLLQFRSDGTGPDVIIYLDSEPGLEPEQVAAVLMADQRSRWQGGDRVTAEWYLSHFPAVAAHPDHSLDLIYGEYFLREELGESPDLEEYVARFPRHARTIGLQVAFHRALDPDPPPTVGEDPRESPAAGPGPAIPGYRILHELGAGGMGIVYEAEQVGLNRRVALKMIRPGGLVDPDYLARFHLEAEFEASLHHPNIVDVYEIGEARGCAYFSMGLVEGGSLARDLKDGPMTTARAARLAETLARAMHHAHLRGIIHRDLKPSNVLLTRDGVPKIADFGLAKDLESDSEQTQSGTILGSPCYMSPEQASGRTRDVGPSTDIYSLGSILYEMLTGVPPFRAATPLETLQALLTDEPVAPSKLRPGIPPDLETVCLKCLEKVPKRRYASALDLAEDLRRFLDHEPVSARPVARYDRAWRWCRRKPALAIASGLAAIALLVTLVVSISFAIYQYRAAQRIGDAMAEVSVKRKQVDQMTANLAYEHGQNLCERGDVDQGMHWHLKSLKSASLAGDPDLESAIWRNLSGWYEQLHPLRRRWQHPGDVRAIAYSPDGRLLATAGDDFTLRLWDVATGHPAGTFRHPEKVGAVAFSPDGRKILTGCDDGRARRWDARTGSPIGEASPHTNVVYSVAFSPDGKRFLTGSYDGTARLWDSATGKPLCEPMPHTDRVLCVAFSPDGRVAISGGWDKRARLWDAFTGRPIGEPLTHQDWISSVGFSPDGSTILTASYDRTCRLWDRATGRPRGRPMVHQHCVRTATFSRDGRSILTGCYDGTARLWDTATGRTLGTLLRHQHTVSAVAFSPDGRSVATGSFDRSARIWDIASRPAPRIEHGGFIRAVLFSPDGRTILSASQDRTARLWEASTGRPIGPPLAHGDSVEAIAFSPDGKLAVTGSYDRTARLWHVSTGEPASGLLSHSARVETVAFSPDGRSVLTGDEGGTAQLWDVPSGRPLGPPLMHTESVKAVAFSPDGKHVLTGSFDHTARIWDAATGLPVGEPLRHNGRVTAVVFSSDGTTALTGSDDMTARLWNIETGGLRCAPLQHNGPVSAVALSLDGSIVITGGWDRVARLWEAATGRPIIAPLRHEGTLRALAISPDGRSVLTGSYDRTAQLWDTVTGRPIGPAFRHESQVWFVQYSPDGRDVISGGQENSAYLWRVPAAIEGPVSQVELELQVATGMALGDDGSMEILSPARWAECKDSLQASSPLGHILSKSDP